MELANGPQAMSAQETADASTIAVCNAVESTLCYTALDDWVANNCAAARKDPKNDEYFTNLSASCAVTNRRRTAGTEAEGVEPVDLADIAMP